MGQIIMNTVKINSKKVKMIAHRGLSGLERENTCAAFVAAGNRSYYGIETDVHKTADGKYIIIHDETTERVTLGKYNINVEKSYYSEVMDITLPDLDGSTNRKDIKIPLLIDYIKICKKYGKVCVLEFKNPFKQSDIEEIISIIRDEDYLDKMIFISFVLGNCKILRSLLPDGEIQWLLSKEITEENLAVLNEYRLGLDCHYAAVSTELINRIHDLGLEINCWTCDKKEIAEKLVDMGVDYITTNILE